MFSISNKSKPLSGSDESGSEFTREMLQGDPTYGINFDRIQWDSKDKCWILIENLRCHEKQFSKGITPFSSHPNRYFSKNSMKFVRLWELTLKLKGKLFLVNYSKLGTKFGNEVLLMEVKNVNRGGKPPVDTKDTKFSRDEYSKWFREMNKRGK